MKYTIWTKYFLPSNILIRDVEANIFDSPSPQEAKFCVGGAPGGSSIHTGPILAKNASYLEYKIIWMALLFKAYIIDKIENKNIEKLEIGIFYNFSG